MVMPMVTLRLVCLLALVVIGGMARAEPDEQSETTAALQSPTQKPAPAPDKQTLAKQYDTRKQEVRTRALEWLKTCLSDWDRATHMTKTEWRTTCERVALERGKFLLDNPTVGAGFLGNPSGRQR